MVKSTVNTISYANTNAAGSSATKGATTPAVSCARNNSSNMVVLREWYNDNEKYCKDKYQGFNSSLTWDDKTNTATVFMSGNGSVNYVNIKPGKDGSYIKDGKLYVDQAVLMKNLGPVIDPAAKKIHDVDALIIGTAIGAKGISSGVNIVKGISGTDAAGSAAAVAGGTKIVVGKNSEVTGLLDKMPELSGSTREKLMSTVQNTDLKKIVNELYRPGATVGDGGTAAKLIQEFYEGSSTHLIKAQQRMSQLSNLGKSGKLNPNDMDILEALTDDLNSAINLFK